MLTTPPLLDQALWRLSMYVVGIIMKLHDNLVIRIA